MIDHELRQMFAEREASAPAERPVAERITVGVARRRRQVRLVRSVTAFVVVTLVAVAVPAAVSRWRGAGLSTPGTTPSPNVSPAVPTPRVSALPLVPAPVVEVTMPVTPGWLPDQYDGPSFTEANMLDGTRKVAYEYGPTGILVDSVTITTFRARPPDSATSDDGSPPEDEREVDVRGHRAVQRISGTPVGRTCSLSWEESPGVWVLVQAYVSNHDGGLARAVRCEVGRHVARSLIQRPFEMDHQIRLTLVPAGYALYQVDTNIERWCAPLNAPPREIRCLTAEFGLRPEGHPDFNITVNGHQGVLVHAPTAFALMVPGYVALQIMPSLDDSARTDGPPTVDISDAGLIRIAETAVLARPW
jgi:hypothetical protein